ncbi:hypothetical protein [Psychromarinibacter sp. S121]|uniref:hypothetical protein n=1 Tax=Psychromarinibacter sp. S121 TaxID=3415127 RepID=UPI003C7C7703
MVNSENETMEDIMLDADQYILISRMALNQTAATERPERRIIAGRVASHRKWNRRRKALRLRAALFGRRKLAARCGAGRAVPAFAGARVAR